jgi:hypothetical protein
MREIRFPRIGGARGAKIDFCKRSIEMLYAGVQEFMHCGKLVKGTSAYTQLKEAHDMIMFSSETSLETLCL